MAIGGGGQGGIVAGGNLELGWGRLERRGGRGGCLLRRGDFLFSFCFRSSKVLHLFRFICLGVWGAEFVFFLRFLIQCK